MNNVKNTAQKVKLLLKIVKDLNHRRYTVEGLATRFKTSTRTMYRYLKVIEDIGYPIDRDFKGEFFIVESDCPLCKAMQKTFPDAHVKTAVVK